MATMETTKKKVIKRVKAPKNRAPKNEIAAPVLAEDNLETEELPRLRWTFDEYYRLGELGIFDNRRVELIDGEICEMSPMTSPHAASVTRAHSRLYDVLGRDVLIRVQLPLRIESQGSEPEPDVAVVQGRDDFYSALHPTTALLIVEVSHTTLTYDRRTKSGLYACANVPEYWILNLAERQLEVRRNPAPHATARFGFSYRSLTIYDENQSVAPLCAPETEILVADLLP